MATVLRFRTRRVPPRHNTNPKTMCDVVIFPGVRYERKTKREPEGPRAKPKRRKAR